jgi:hypothetical protein
VWSVGRQCGRQGGGGIWVAARTAARRRGRHMDAIRADRASARGWVGRSVAWADRQFSRQR